MLKIIGAITALVLIALSLALHYLSVDKNDKKSKTVLLIGVTIAACSAIAWGVDKYESYIDAKESADFQRQVLQNTDETLGHLRPPAANPEIMARYPQGYVLYVHGKKPENHIKIGGPKITGEYDATITVKDGIADIDFDFDLLRFPNTSSFKDSKVSMRINFKRGSTNDFPLGEGIVEIIDDNRDKPVWVWGFK